MSPLERFEHYSARIERYNPELNAYLDLRLEAARREAEASEDRHRQRATRSSVDGLCVAVKANIAVAGLPCHAGIGAYRNEIAQQDAQVVTRLKGAGAVILGTVNMHEGALGATTDNPFFGRTHNPWRRGLTPGGSSGGSGAAVAAGLCDIALGSDTMGSVRIPSAYCGCQGHKPTTGCVSNDGVLALSHTLDHVGPLARRVGDLHAALNAITAEPVPARPTDLAGLRIGVWDGGDAIGVSPDVAAGLSQASQAIQAAGGLLSGFEPPAYDYGRSRRAGLLTSEVEAHGVHAERLAQEPDGFSDGFRALMDWGVRQPADKIEAAYAHLIQVREAARAVWKTVDVVLAPTAPQTAFSFEADVPANQADFTAWADFAALPATAVWAGQSDDGLPLSVQVIGAEGEDARVLGVAAALEALFGAPPLPPAYED